MLSTARPTMTVDDAVIITSAGLSAPLIARGSRRLAAGTLDRTRSLRRVASEADLSESTGPTDEYRFSDVDVADIPLTVDAARSRHISRDFTFARGISPPPLTSPPPEYSSPTRDTFVSAMSNIQTSYHSLESRDGAQDTLGATVPTTSSSQTTLTAQTTAPMGTAYEFSTSTSFASAQASSPSAMALQGPSSASTYTARLITAVEGSRPSTSSATLFTAPSTAAYSETITVPTMALTEASPTSTYRTATTGLYRAEARSSTTVAESGQQSYYETARDSAYSTAPGGLMSPFEISDERDSRLSTWTRATASTYDTAPPPVPSRDSRYVTASAGRSSAISRDSSPQRFQLRDAPVRIARSSAPSPSEKSQYTATHNPESSYRTARPPTTHHDSDMTVHQSTPTKSRSSYTTAPPPPISRSVTNASERLSWQSDAQELAETATHVSEPDTDLGLLADLERQSSFGSTFSRQSAGGIVRSQYETAAQWSSVTARQTAYGTVPEGTVYETAVATMYTDAPSWQTPSTYMTTAQGTQE